jgi:hypothetical protein
MRSGGAPLEPLVCWISTSSSDTPRRTQSRCSADRQPRSRISS